MRHLLCRTALVLVLAACGGEETAAPPAGPEMTGTWSGQVTSEAGTARTLSITVNENEGKISGSGSLREGNATLALGVTGAYDPPEVTIRFGRTGFEPMNLTGTVEETRIRGLLNGSGYVNRVLTLTRE